MDGDRQLVCEGPVDIRYRCLLLRAYGVTSGSIPMTTGKDLDLVLVR